MNGNPIGQRVNLLVEVSPCSWKMSEETYEVVREIPWSEELNDWCEHLVIKDSEGNEREVRECDCVYSPDYSKQYIEDTIQSFLDDNGVWSEVYTEIGGAVVVVHIDWGDWKHEHLWARDLMQYIGYCEIGDKVTEEDGSDCYSATHYFVKEV